MTSMKKITNISGWAVFAIAFMVYLFSVERTGSLWDCGEFILGAYKLQVVHPPGAPIFLLVGRMFTWVASLVSDDPANIAFAVNLMSGICTAFTAMFVAWITITLGQFTLTKEEDGDFTQGQKLALGASGIVAGLATAFTSSIWFSAVEGEVYAMSTMFTAMTFWAVVKWYGMDDKVTNDRWLVFAAFSAGLSIGVHLLSLLTLPAIALLYYFKKNKTYSFFGVVGSMAAGVGLIAFVQKFIIVGIPTLWKVFEVPMVNSMGMPFHSGLIPTLLLVFLAAFFFIRLAQRRNSHLIHLLTMGAIMMTIGFSTIGTVVIRANADTPVNMNVPSDALRLLPYLNREQYGERPLLYGPHFDAQPIDIEREERYGRVGDKYEVVEEKYTQVFRGSDKMLFPRVSHSDPARRQLYREWWGEKTAKPTLAFNLWFAAKYQVSWMYWRYFLWNYVGRQNGDQGYMPYDKSDGHWISGIKIFDEMKLFDQDYLPSWMKENKARNTYFFLPLIFGLLGVFFHFGKRKKEFLALAILFLITGIGIIIYSNQPPNEPRERDYVLVGSFFTFCIWIGMGVLAVFSLLRNRLSLGGVPAAAIAGILTLSAPLIMGFQNFDDHSRRNHTAARDYAANFLESCAPNSIIFTYGDNDTYPLWYAQQVENIRTDVRVVNLSLIAVDWYIEKLRNKVDNSPPLKLSISPQSYRGKNRNQVWFYPDSPNTPTSIYNELAFINDEKNTRNGQTLMRTKKLYIPVNKQAMLNLGGVSPSDTNIVDRIDIDLSMLGTGYITKDDLAVLDVIASNINDRPIYFATTSQNKKLLGLNDYMQYEGLGLRIVPVKTKSYQSNETYRNSIYDSGRVNTDLVYDNIMNKFTWGNFDKLDLFVNSSYGAEVQSHRIIMMRAALQMIQENKLSKAVELTDKYFEAFPNTNFPYTGQLEPFFRVYASASANAQFKKHALTLANNLREEMIFYDSIGEDVIKSSFEYDYYIAVRGVSDLLRLTQQIGDTAFLQELNTLIGEYNIQPARN